MPVHVEKTTIVPMYRDYYARHCECLPLQAVRRNLEPRIVERYRPNDGTKESAGMDLFR